MKNIIKIMKNIHKATVNPLTSLFFCANIYAYIKGK